MEDPMSNKPQSTVKKSNQGHRQGHRQGPPASQVVHRSERRAERDTRRGLCKNSRCRAKGYCICGN
jgi:hypothetical protein